MVKLIELVEFVSGSPQFRITESFVKEGPMYIIYSQNDLRQDINGLIQNNNENKMIFTMDNVTVVSTNDIIFSLISGEAAIVSNEHNGYLFTQNYVRLIPKKRILPQFLVYCLNQDSFVKKQFQEGLQGSEVMKYTLRQLKELELSILPSLSKQQKIGDIYLKQLKVEALHHRVAELGTLRTLKILKEEMQNE